MKLYSMNSSWYKQIIRKRIFWRETYQRSKWNDEKDFSESFKSSWFKFSIGNIDTCKNWSAGHSGKYF